jgi:phage protein D
MPQVEQKKNSQMQIKINHEYYGDVGKKKKTRIGRRRHSIYNQDANMMSTNQKKKDDLAQIKCYECDAMGNIASRCPNNLEKKAQANEKRQDDVKQNLRKKEKAQTKRTCYTRRERGHMANGEQAATPGRLASARCDNQRPPSPKLWSG